MPTPAEMVKILEQHIAAQPGVVEVKGDNHSVRYDVGWISNQLETERKRAATSTGARKTIRRLNLSNSFR